MESDNTAIGLGIPYFILIVLTWITAGAFTESSPYDLWILTAHGGLYIFIGCLLLIPVFVLTIIFLATNEDSCESVAFGLGLPGWFLIIVGAIISLYFAVADYLIPTLLLVFLLPLIILGFGLFARRNHNPVTRRPSYTRRPDGRAFQERRRQPPRGTVTIPAEVRIASTYGQPIKRCVQCGHNLDLKTRVCFFCGARQPGEPARPPVHRPPPVTPSTYQRVQTPGARQGFSYCPNCGQQITRGHLFCTQCGASLD